MSESPKKIPKRVVLYTRDVENITGRKERAARRLLQRVREKFSIPKDGFVTVREFSLYTGIDADLVYNFLMD